MTMFDTDLRPYSGHAQELEVTPDYGLSGTCWR
jgi:hypothetical protein